MITYHREEPFRITFGKCLNGKMKVVKVDEKTVEAKEKNILILDLSLHGMRITTDFDLATDENRYLVEVSFILNEREFKLIGVPRWKRQIGTSEFSYGIKMENDEITQRNIMEEFRLFTNNELQEWAIQ